MERQEGIVVETLNESPLPIKTRDLTKEEDMEYFPITILDDNESFLITNNGTAQAPCSLTLIPKVDMESIKIEGLSDEPMTFGRVFRGQILVIDGINKNVTLDDLQAFDMFDGWSFPRLSPGINTIKINNAIQLNISITYNPRYI